MEPATKNDDGECNKHWHGRRRRRQHPIKTALQLVVLGIVLYQLWNLRSLVVVVFFALTLAAAIAPVAEYCESRWKAPRVATVLTIYALIGLLYSVLAAALYPTLKEQSLSLYEHLPDYASGLNDWYFRIRELLGENAGSIAISPNEIKGFVSNLSRHMLHFTTDLVTVIVSGILVAFLTAYFVIEASSIWPKLLEWVPKDRRERMAGIIRPLEGRLGGYVRGQLLVSLAVSAFLTIGLSCLQVEHALLLGALSGLLNLVPFVGSMITCVLAILVAFNQSPMLAAAVVGLFALEQWVESNFIVPNLLGKQVELHPLIVLFAILIGGSIMGVPGALVAVPLATATMFLAEEFYLRPLKESEGEAPVSVAPPPPAIAPVEDDLDKIIIKDAVKDPLQPQVTEPPKGKPTAKTAVTDTHDDIDAISESDVSKSKHDDVEDTTKFTDSE